LHQRVFFRLSKKTEVPYADPHDEIPTAMEISSLPGLGPKSQEMLAAAGITSVDMLKQLGSVRAYAKVKQTGCKPSLNLLWGLESAISGLPWQEVAKTHRTSLLVALDALDSRS
jgi:DNA transformation protein and related proteins